MKLPAAPGSEGRHLGSALVVLQFVALGVLAVLAGDRWHGAPLGAWLPAAAGGGLGLWAVVCNRPGNFNIHPTPRAGGQLVQAGPYRFIRHPMYTAVLAFGWACAWTAAAGPQAMAGLVAAALLTAVLWLKASLEERWLLRLHPDYAAYRQRSWRFLPWLL